ncbi:MAG: hypothetical protein H0U59_13595 [Gemmatimonadaceae bacterium]|nr:hypothetical protein [Gemmatimonadaceae bacterium]
MRFLALIVPLIVVQGCWLSSGSAHRDAVTKRVYHETVAPDGSKSGYETITTAEDSASSSKSGVDPEQVQGMISAAISAAMGATGLGGFDWAGLAAGGVALATGGLALAKNSEAKRSREEAAAQKADADQAWDRLLPPKAES